MLSKYVEIPTLIEPDKLLRFFEILDEPFGMDRRLDHQSYAYVQERVVIGAVYESRVSDHLGERIACLVRKSLRNSDISRHSETANWTRQFNTSSKNNPSIQ